ncbi:MAG: hypothetical protein V2I33_13040, partial [Kangiellaceae bacterium]|nr:hypothetical protein [Kangiellaceae bacterium]
MKSTIPKPYKNERQVIYNKRFGVIFNGEDNLKPVITENAIDLSPTASQCADTYESFLGGGGFEVDMSGVDLSDNWWDAIQPNDILSSVCHYASRHQGCFILVGYNALFQKDHFKVIPYELCRVGKRDSKDFSGRVLVAPKGWGKNLKKEEVDVYDAYNPQPDVIQAQVERDGGWDNYKGQIMFFKMDNKYVYPLPLIDRAMPFCETEYHMGLYYLS